MADYKRLYHVAGVQSTSLRSACDRSDLDYEDKRPGFFKSFNSIDDVVMQVKAPIIMPIICLSQTLKAAIDFVKNVLLCVPNLLLGDFRKTAYHVMTCGSNFYDFFEGIFKAVIDTVWELTVLSTRLVATCFYAVVAEKQSGPSTIDNVASSEDGGLTYNYNDVNTNANFR